MQDKEKSISNNIDINESDSDMNTIKTRLNTLSSQLAFIQILKENIKSLSSGNKEANLKQEKIDYILVNLIKDLGIPFCALINNSKEIMDYYCNQYLKNPNNDLIKNILINFINVFNYKSSTVNPSDNIINCMEKAGYKDAKNLRKNKRTEKTEIENIYDDLIELYNTWKNIREMGNNIEEDGFGQLQLSLNEKIEKINELEKNEKFQKSTIEFFNNIIQKIQDFKDQKNKNTTPHFFDNNQNSSNNNSICLSNSIHSNNEKNDNINSEKFEGVLSEEELKKLREIPLKERTSFYKNELLAYGEDETTEFKYYIYPLLKEQEKELKRQYIGFLNSKGGRIYIGITDQKIVKGVVLTYKNCDTFRNTLVGYSNDFFPKCRLDKIKVYFIPIKNTFIKKFIHNLYVVKIIVLPGDPYSLYSITDKSGFISGMRRQSQVFNLTAEEITKEIIERNELKKKAGDQINVPELNIGFNDPEPEKNFQVHINHTNKDNINKDFKDFKDHKTSSKDKKGIKNNRTIVYIVNIRNIDKNLKVKEINKHFNGCGCSYQKFFSKEGKSLGYGKIHFASEDAAKAAIAKYNGDTLGGKKKILMSMRKSFFFNKINK